MVTALGCTARGGFGGTPTADGSTDDSTPGDDTPVVSPDGGFPDVMAPLDGDLPPTDVVTPGDVVTPTDAVKPPVDVVTPPTDVVTPPTDVVTPPTDVVTPPTDVPMIVCTAGAARCTSSTTREVCNSSGTALTPEPCPSGATCVDGVCNTPMACTPGTTRCGADGVSREVCNSSGTAYTNTPCPTAPHATASCAGGTCSASCTGTYRNCNGVASDGCEADTATSAANCGACGAACPSGQTCTAGSCVPGTTSGATFRVDGLGLTGCRTMDHESITGDDRGGVAISSSRFFVIADGLSGNGDVFRFDPTALTAETTGTSHDGIITNLRDESVWAFSTSAGVPYRYMGESTVTLTHLTRLNSSTGALGTESIAFSTPLTVTTGTAVLFAGYDRVAVATGTFVYDIALPSGVVTTRTLTTPIAAARCENWASWGVAEFFDGELYVDYVASASQISRTRVRDGMTTALGSFTNLSDMCSFVVSPSRRRWYFHHENASQFASVGNEFAGYCDAAITVSTVACTGGQVACGTSGCVDLATSVTNCGACGRACTAGQTCNTGVCGTAMRYTLTTPPSSVAFVDVCTTGSRVLASVDDNASITTLPFNFTYWGRALTTPSLALTTNGYFTFDTSTGVQTTGLIPDLSAPNSVIAPLWRDLVTGTNGVCFATLDAAPSRRFVVEWSGARNYPTSTSSTLTFEAILYEGTNNIDFLYQTLTPASSATVGLEDSTGMLGAGGCTGSATCTPTAGTRLRFTPG